MFWFGDLNYRIESSVAALEVLDHALAGRLLFLAENDQLNTAREAGDAFDDFYEGESVCGGSIDRGRVAIGWLRARHIRDVFLSLRGRLLCGGKTGVYCSCTVLR